MKIEYCGETYEPTLEDARLWEGDPEQLLFILDHCFPGGSCQPLGFERMVETVEQEFEDLLDAQVFTTPYMRN